MIIKQLKKIAELDFKIARIKNGTDKETNEKKQKFINELYKTVNIDNIINNVNKIITK